MIDANVTVIFSNHDASIVVSLIVLFVRHST